MTIARSEIVREGAEAMYHCVVRCVRRAFLCGWDSYRKKNFDHRKAWIRERIKELAGIFALDVAGYAVMSNHLHLILRTRPDVLNEWSDEKVANRWLRLFPRCRGTSDIEDSTELQNLLKLPGRIEELRGRLGSISWFMRCLNERIARMANREDNCKGRFWEGRFKCQRILSEGALLACMTYVDLNPIRARAATTPENSEYTSVHDRITAREARRKLRRLRKSQKGRPLSGRQRALIRQESLHSSTDAWLAPIQSTGRRKGLLPFSLEHYLQLLDRTGRMIRNGKRGTIPATLKPLLQRLDLNIESWLETVQALGSLFHRVVGKAEEIEDAAKQAGRRFLKGIAASQKVFSGTD